MKQLQKKILIVDDAPDNLVLLATFLKASGYRVDCTSNGEEALSLLRVSSDLPDLILLDAQMPVMDGYEFRKQQRGDTRIREIPVVIMTAEDDDFAINLEMLDPLLVLHKPLRIKSLAANLSRCLSVDASQSI